MTITVGYLIGSQSKRSINRKLAEALVRLAPAGFEFTEIDYSALANYDHDLDADYPAEATAFKAAIEGVDALLFVTPEYNRSIPGALKNAIDWGSRPWGTNSFAGKPAGVIGASIGAIGTALAQQHLRNILSFLGTQTMAQPEGYVQVTEGLITDEGEVTNESTAAFLASWIESYARFVEAQLGR